MGYLLLANIAFCHEACLEEKILLSVNLIDKTSDLLTLDLVANKNHQLICPSPAVADEMRLLLGQNPAHQRPQVLTISKFIQDLLQLADLDRPVVRKSELMLPMATIWKKYDDQCSYETFQQAFTMFTELRSFTTQKELLEEVFERCDTRLNFALQVFWAYLDAEQICDEHEAYAFLTQWLKEEDTEDLRSFEAVSFFGFSHLNANQVDFIKALSLRSQVCLPFYREVFDLTMNWDFIRWLSTEEKTEASNEPTKKELKLVNFPMGRLNEVLTQYFENYPTDKKVDITLLTKDLSLRFLSEIPKNKAYFKAPADLFSEPVSELSHFLHDFVRLHPEGVPTEQVAELLESAMQDLLKQEFEKKDFRKIKVYQQMLVILERYQELSDLNQQIKLYDLKILIDILSLDSPRVYSIPLVDTSHPEQIRGLESVGSLNPQHKNLLIFTGQYSSFKSGSSLFDQETLAILASFGPIKRKELEFLILKKKISEALSLPDVTLFLESGLEKTDPAWDELLKEYAVQPVPVAIKTKVMPLDYFKPSPDEKVRAQALEKISATKLQSYADCPRKFYYLYLENLTSREEISTELRPDELGTIQHKVIEDYASHFPELDLVEHKKMASMAINGHIQKQGRSIPFIAYKKYLAEVENYSLKGLKFIFALKEKFPEIRLSFEKKLQEDPDAYRRGSIDLYFETDEGKGIIDFKRSLGSIPSQKALLQFDKVQLWFYLTSLGLEFEDMMMMGFLNLSEPMDSLIICANNDLKSLVAEFGAKGAVIKEAASYLGQYQEFEKSLLEKLQNDQEFLPKPKNLDVCKYCELTNICSRGNHVG